jgi:dihydrofolate reductase
MLIRTRTGVTVDGFVAGPDRAPVLVSMPQFQPGVSYGYEEFISNCDAVVMGRTTFLPALDALSWPWPGLDVYVLTSTPLPAQTPRDVTAGTEGTRALLELWRTRGSNRDVHLVGGRKTIRASDDAGALDQLELLVLPFMAGNGLPLSPEGALPMNLQMLRSGSRHPDGAVEIVHAPE